MLSFFRSLFQRRVPARGTGNAELEQPNSSGTPMRGSISETVSDEKKPEKSVGSEREVRNPSGVETPTALPVPASGAMTEEPKIEIHLGRALRDVDPVRLGFDPGKVPEYVVLTLPLHLIRRQLALGKVEVGLADLKSGLLPQYHAAFQTVEEDFRAAVPLSEIFPLLPPEVIESLLPDDPESDPGVDGQRGVNPAWSTPFSAVEGPAPAPVPVANSPVADGQTGGPPVLAKIPALSPLMQRRVILSRPPGGGRAVLPADGAAGLRGLSTENTRQSPCIPAEPLILEEPEDELGESFSAASLMAEPPFPPDRKAFPLPSAIPVRKNGHLHGSRNGSQNVHSDLLTNGGPRHVRNRAELARQRAEERCTLNKIPAQEDIHFGGAVDVRQLTLRAVLGTDEWLTPQSVVDYCALLEGLSACMLLRGQEVFKSRGLAAADAEAFAAGAGRTLESLAVVAGAMGMGGAGDFTLRTDQGVRSFFLGCGLCLAVWHDRPVFSGGTREKLLLITRELSNLSDS